MNPNGVYVEILADLMPMPDLIEYVRQCYVFGFNFEEEKEGKYV